MTDDNLTFLGYIIQNLVFTIRFWAIDKCLHLIAINDRFKEKKYKDLKNKRAKSNSVSINVSNYGKIGQINGRANVTDSLEMDLNNETNWKTVQTVAAEHPKKFWKAILLAVIKPHVINRRLAGAETISILRCQATQLNSGGKFIRQIAHIIQNYIKDVNEDFLANIINQVNTREEFEDVNRQNPFDFDLNEEKQILVILNKLLPKNLTSHKCTFEIAILDSEHNQAAFLNLLQNQTTGFIKKFIVQLNHNENGGAEMNIKVPNEDNENFSRQLTWLTGVFMPKISKWLISVEQDDNDRQKSAFSTLESLSLINLTEYNQLYNDLKVKYGENMVKIWPEQTDPLKFVYEDVAIASYLILLWKEERRRLNTEQLQSFVDMGCGNGLLVYILSSEGHHGYGIDVRKRGIWDLYPSTTVLKTHAIVPSDRSLFPDVDWIIGNHSDELSPWIPVISARSSYNSRYFLLPCCAFEFSGKKFQRRCSSVSQYMDFLSYAQQISEACGFETNVDRLKIPSTKRICLIGCKRTYPSDEQNKRCDQIQDFINANSTNQEIIPDAKQWNNEFQPRSNVEKIQNCTTIDKGIQNDIVDMVFQELIKKKRYIPELCHPNWNVGGRISLVDLASIIPNEKLKALKSECGGLQTLLKNRSQIFRISNGAVELKVPIKWSDKKRELEAKGIEINLKRKPCWFHNNHPDGCPLNTNDCSFEHRNSFCK